MDRNCSGDQERLAKDLMLNQTPESAWHSLAGFNYWQIPLWPEPFPITDGTLFLNVFNQMCALSCRKKEPASVFLSD